LGHSHPLNRLLWHYLLPDGCVVGRFKMLTYYRVRSAFEAAQALPSNKI